MLEIADRFCFDGKPLRCDSYGNGLVNRTYHVVCDSGSRYILQQVNTSVFTDPVSLMENVDMVTCYLKGQVQSEREALSLVPAVDGNIYVDDERCGFWRAYEFISGSMCLETAEHPCDIYQGGLAFGRFIDLLSRYPAHTLTETIPAFHDTVSRYRAFREALELDPGGRVANAQKRLTLHCPGSPFPRFSWTCLGPGGCRCALPTMIRSSTMCFLIAKPAPPSVWLILTLSCPGW